MKLITIFVYLLVMAMGTYLMSLIPKTDRTAFNSVIIVIVLFCTMYGIGSLIKDICNKKIKL